MTSTPSILVATWEEGLLCVRGDSIRQEIAGETVRGLVADGAGGVLAVVGGRSLRRRSPSGEWTTLAESDLPLACCALIGDALFVGTDDANVLRLDADAALRRLESFDAVEGRERWYAGAAIVDGKLMGPPLGVRSMSSTCDGGALLVNVHVGGVPRSTDLGVTWRPTIDVDADVHQVRAHPARPEIVIAATAIGLGVSRDAGASWTIEDKGLHAPHCSAVGFTGDDILVAASEDPFSPLGAIYRRPLDGDGPLEPLGDGFPRWIEGRADTDCIATNGASIAVIDGSGRLYVSEEGAPFSSRQLDAIGFPAALHIL